MGKPSRRQVILGVLLVGSILFLLHGMRGASLRQTREQERAPADAAPPAVASELRPAAPEDVAFDRYAQLSKTNVFSEHRSGPPRKEPRSVPPPPPLPGGNGTKKQPPSPKSDFAGWSYVGYVLIGGEQLGILQNDTTKACKNLAVGESFQGATVESIDRKAIRLRSGTSPPTTLTRPRDFPITPLAKPAKPADGPPRARREN
jgi:hypothetical protein